MADVEVARLVAKLEADVRDFDRDLKKAEKRIDKFGKEAASASAQTEKHTQGMASAFKNVGAVVAGAAVTGAVIQFGRDTVRAASDVNESINAVEKTFGDASGAVLQLSDDAAQTVGLSKSQFNSLAVSVSAFAKSVAGDGGDVAQVMDNLTTRMADFASVMNLEVEEAATVFRSGLAGETEPLRKFGIDVSAAAVNTKALALGLAESSSELTEGDKVLARYQLIMEQTNSTAGDFADTAGDLANQQRTFSAELEDTKARIGESLQEPLADLLGTLEDLLPLLEQLGRPFRGLAIVTATNKMEKFERQTGHAVGTTENLVGALQDAAGDIAPFGESIVRLDDVLLDFLDSADISDDALRRLRDNLEFLVSIGAFTEQQAEQLAAVIQDRLHASLTAAQGSAEGAGLILQNGMTPAMIAATKASGDLAGEQKETAEAAAAAAKAFEFEAERIERANKGLRDQREALKNIHDPLFRALGFAEDAAEAQDVLNEAQKNGTEGSDEAVEAAERFIDANRNLIDILVDLEKNGIDPTGEAVRAMFANMDVPQETIDRIFADFLAIKAFIEGLNPLLTIDMFLPEIPEIPATPPSSTPVPIVERHTRLQHGGPLMAGQPALVGEAGPELFVPRTSGDVIPNNALGGTTIIVEGNVTDETLEDIQRELLLASLSQIGEVG